MGRSEAADLARLAALAGRIFHSPIAYVALLQPDGQPICRIGAGTEYWDLLESLAALRNLVSPVVVQDIPHDIPNDIRDEAVPHDDIHGDRGELSFAAVAPIETLCRKPLGRLVIGDHTPRPTFTADDLANLTDLADIVADRIEMRIIAAQAVMTRSLYREAISPHLPGREPPPC